CGAVKAIIKSQSGQRNMQECRIIRIGKDGATESLDMRIWATPFKFASEEFTIFATIDISD
ncbi:MAG: histidine kinase, partial [Anaerolineae bacterium]